MNEFSKYQDVLKVLSEDSPRSRVAADLLKNQLPKINIPTKTMGGEVFWENIAEANGYKFQRNTFTHHARVLNSNNVRIAWGSIQEMIEAMDYVADKIAKI